ncbi:MAG: hypothetical protein ABIP79_05655 [Chitinophagaceae bacterium]
MTEIVIDKKKYVSVLEKEYQDLQLKAALKSTKKLSLAVGKKLTKKLIKKWAKEK